jgi:hypothetical protein
VGSEELMPRATRDELTPSTQIKDGKTDGWTKRDLIERARQIGIMGRSRMSKTELIKALREH